MVQLKVVNRGARYFDSPGMGDQALKSDLHFFTLAESLFDKVGLTLQEYELAARVDVLNVELG